MGFGNIFLDLTRLTLRTKKRKEKERRGGKDDEEETEK